VSRAAMAAVALTAALMATAAPARAEEGLFVARLVGGASAMQPDSPSAGGMLAGSADLCISERTGLLGGSELVWHDSYTTLAFGVALKHLPYEGEWTRLYVYAGPAALLAWSHDRDGEPGEWDLAGQAGVGFEYLMMWGLGLSFELRGTAPLGVGRGERFDAASASLGAGLFMEF